MRGNESRVVLLAMLFTGVLAAQDWGIHFDTEVQRLLRAGKAEQALARLDQLIAAEPNVSMTWCQRAYVDGRLGRFEAGIRDATRAIELDADNPVALLERGYQLHQTDKLELALADFDRAIALDPNQPVAFGDRGDVRQSMGDCEAAIADYDEAIRLRPDFPAALYNRARCLRALGQLRRARDGFSAAIKLLPGKAGFWYERAWVENELGLRQEARQSISQAIGLEPKAKDWLVTRAEIAWLGGDDQAAVLDLTRAALWSQDRMVAARAYRVLGGVQLGRDNANAAAAAFAEAARRDSAATAPWDWLMLWCAQCRGDLAKACAALEATASGMPLSQQQQQLVALCARGEGDSATLATRGRDPTDACTLLFFSGWRAECEGRRDEALHKFVRCVNTCCADWLQWQLAAAFVRRWTAQHPLRVGFGVELKAGSDASLIVASLRSDGPAESGGLATGDAVLTVNNQPATLAAWQDEIQDAPLGLPVRLTIRRGSDTFGLWMRAGYELD